MGQGVSQVSPEYSHILSCLNCNARMSLLWVSQLSWSVTKGRVISGIKISGKLS